MMNLNNKEWICKGVIYDGEEFIIDELNIWNHTWQSTGKTVKVKDPTYKKIFKGDVFKIEFNETKFDFVAVEFSNFVWGIYQNE